MKETGSSFYVQWSSYSFCQILLAIHLLIVVGSQTKGGENDFLGTLLRRPRGLGDTIHGELHPSSDLHRLANHSMRTGE